MPICSEGTEKDVTNTVRMAPEVLNTVNVVVFNICFP